MTAMVCCVTPVSIEETKSTLNFASRAKTIQNAPVVNMTSTADPMINELQLQLRNVTKQLEDVETELQGSESRKE